MKNPHAPSGFTLVETLVSVVLLTTTIVLPYYAIQKSLSATFESRDDLIASSLAQEALEYVRGIRDNNFLAGRTGPNWLHKLDGGLGEFDCFHPNRCTIDATRDNLGSAIVQCPQNDCSGTPLRLSSSHLYTQQTVTGTVLTKYERYIQLKCLAYVGSDCVQVEVTATVTWFERGTHIVRVVDVLTNWL